MNYIKLVGIIISILPNIIKAVEAFMPDSGQGAEKKDVVKTMIRSMVDAVISISTGGQAETWAKIEPLIDSVIDNVVSLFNLFGVFKK